MFPGKLLLPTYPDPKSHRILVHSEVERRGEYIKLLEAVIGTTQPDLVTLVKECLHNNNDYRPSAREVLAILQGIERKDDLTHQQVACNHYIIYRICNCYLF